MDRAVEMIVVCAQMNEHFSFMYADLCRRITDNWSSGTVDDEEESLGKHFRVKLLERCKDEFSIDRVQKLEDIRALEISDEDKEEKVVILKKSYTGHMRFIGESPSPLSSVSLSPLVLLSNCYLCYLLLYCWPLSYTGHMRFIGQLSLSSYSSPSSLLPLLSYCYPTVISVIYYYIVGHYRTPATCDS